MPNDFESAVQLSGNGEHVRVHFGTIWTAHPQASAIGNVIEEDRADGWHWREYSSQELNQAIKVAVSHKRAAERALGKLRHARRQLPDT